VSTDVFVPVQGTRTIAPGRYRHVTVSRQATLFVGNGEYWLNTLLLESHDSVVSISQATTPVRINVAQTLTVRGTFSATPSPTAFCSTISGPRFAAIERPFTGILAAPNAQIALGSTPFQTFTGQFYTKSLEVRPDTTVVCRNDF
jgi:hypothetical protein